MSPSGAKPLALGVHAFAGVISIGIREHFNVVGHLECEQLGGFGTQFADDNFRFPVHVWPYKDWQTHPVVASNVGKLSLVYGNPPCSGFSGMTAGYGNHGPQSTINAHIHETAMIGIFVKAPVILIESVAAAISHANISFLEELKTWAHTMGYRVQTAVTNHLNHNVPQRRPRLFFMLTKINIPVHVTPPKRIVNVWDAISDLEHQPTDVDAPYVSPPLNEWQARLREETPRVTGNWSISGGPALDAAFQYMKPGQALSSMEYEHLPPSYQKARDKGSGFGFMQPYRQRKNETCRVITSAIRLVHPTQDRFMTVRELARMTGVPDYFRFRDLDPEKGMTKHLYVAWLGKGVTVGVAEWIGGLVREALDLNQPADHDDITRVGYEWKKSKFGLEDSYD